MSTVTKAQPKPAAATATAQNGWLVVFSEIDGLRWVLKNRKMAFSAATCPRAARIEPGDEMILYVARGAFHNPTRDRSQVIGLATVAGPVKRLRKPVSIAGRDFTCACPLEFGLVLPERHGVPVEPLVDRLSFIQRKEVWGQYLRSGLIRLSTQDLALLRNKIGHFSAANPQ